MRRADILPLTAALFLLTAALCMSVPTAALAQTAGTGALSGTITDPTGAVVPGASINVTNNATGETRESVTGQAGTYRVPLLQPGVYTVTIQKDGFKLAEQTGVVVAVTETATLNVELSPGDVVERIEVAADVQMLQTESSTLGRVADERVVDSMPLVTRNYTQILALSTGVVSDVTNASEIGRGGGAGTGTNGLHAHGSRSMDNNFQMDGIEVNDIQGDGNIPIPNPDTLQEFKVQTSQYDATHGRNAGANVDVVTKSGSNELHGGAFEFYRDQELNANDFFRNLSGQPRGPLHQNQFGGTIGGPIVKNEVFFFGSYQGTRQKNGLGSDCRSSTLTPPLTDDRSAAAFGAMFGGQRGVWQNRMGGVGPAVAPDGSNINPIALALLQMKNPDGTWYVPNPQSIDTSRPLASQGFSTYADPCSFSEDQAMANADYVHTSKSRFAFRYFFADGEQTRTFPSAGISTDTGVPGSPSYRPERFHTVSLAHTYVFSPNILNELRVGFNRANIARTQQNPYTYSGIGATVPQMLDDLPSMLISGSIRMGGADNQTSIVDGLSVSESLSYLRGKHSLRMGGGITRSRSYVRDFRFNGNNQYLSWPDFLLGLNGNDNGTHVFSNVFVSVYYVGQADRDWSALDSHAYFQDDIKVNRRLTLNLGLRYEHIAGLGDSGGRNGNFDPLRANQNPPAEGSLEGYVVPSNYTGEMPTGVTRLDNKLGIAGAGQNRWGPRVGLAWQMLPDSTKFVLRGGYGIYYTRPVGQATFQLLTAPPYGLINVCPATCNSMASSAYPFGPDFLEQSDFPVFRPYSPDSALTIIGIAQDYQPPITQQYSLGVQTELTRSLLLEVGYAGSRGTHLIRSRGYNQALLASASNPINGVTTNTFDNVSARLPYQGFSATESGVRMLESAGAMWYNALETSLTKRLSNGLQFLASYTFSKTLDTDGLDPDTMTSGGTNVGNQNDPKSRYGPSLFGRTHRFVGSFVYDIPFPENMLRPVLGGWTVSGVATLQTGQHMTLRGSNSTNVTGISSDRVQIASGCSYSNLVTSGSVDSRLNNYFNSACITDWPIVGDDGQATGFGNSGVGIVQGPGQRNFDLALMKRIPVTEALAVTLRGEFFNAFNTPQFSNPGNDTAGGDFGVITSTSVNPRIIQLAVKIDF